MARVPWTPERVELLRTLRADVTLSNAQIGARLGISADSTAEVAKRFGLGKRPDAPDRMRAIQRALSRHTPETIERVRQMWNNGLSYGGIGRAIGETVGVVAGIVTRNGFERRDRPVPDPDKLWSGDEDTVLRDGVAGGLSHKEIALRLPLRSSKAVKARCSLLGLSDEYRFRQDWRFRKRIEARRAASVLTVKNGQSCANFVVVNMAQKRVVAKPMPPLRSIVCESVPLEPDHRGCQWVTSDGRPWMVCANRRDGGRSYCRAHYELSIGGYEPDEPDEAAPEPMREAA